MKGMHKSIPCILLGLLVYSSLQAATEPTVPASNIALDVVASRSLRITWTPGDGEGSLVTLRTQGTAAVPPVDLSDYIADPDYSLAPETSSGSQNYVVYKSTSRSVIVSGLAANVTYTIAVYPWNGTGADTNYLQAGAPELDQITNGPAMHNYDNAADCVDCHNNHGNSGLVPRDAIQEAVCKTCHNATGPASGMLDFALHLTPKYGDVDPDCGSCHEVHRIKAGRSNTTYSTNPITSVTDHNIAFIRANVDKYIGTATPDDAVYHTAGDDLAFEGGDATTSRGICQSCHTLAKYHKHNSAVADSQCHRGGATDACDSSQVDCTSCHLHVDNFAPSGGSCTGCHSSPQAGGPPDGRREIVSEFSLLSHHVAGTLTDTDCEVCHAQSGTTATPRSHMDGQVTLYNVDDHTAAAYQLGDHANPFDVTAQATILTQFCLNCHDADGALAEPTPLSPFSGSGAPPVVDATHWANSSHNTGGDASPVTCFGNGANGCHASGHGSEKQWLMAPYTVPATDPDRSEEREDFCFTCHDADGMSTLDILAQFSGPAIEETSASGALINNRHDILPADQSRSNALVTCKNCHQPHQNTNADPVADPDDDSFLPNYLTSNIYDKDGHNLAYDAGGNLDPTNPEGYTGGARTELDYVRFCLTCHDGTTPPGVTMSSNMVEIAVSYSIDVHGLGEGSTGNKIGRGYLKVPWTTSSDYGNGRDPTSPYASFNCTTCHGPHSSGSIFNLRDSITVAGQQMSVGGKSGSEFSGINGTTYTLPLQGGAQTDHYWGAWCTFCHELSSHPGVGESSQCKDGHMHGGGNF